MALDAHVADERLHSEWDRFVATHNEGTSCHLYGWTSAIESAYHHASYPLVVKRDRDVAGVFPLVRMKGRLAGDRLVSMPFLDQGGILAAGEEEAEALWRAALELSGKLGLQGLEVRGGVPDAIGAPTATRRFRWTLALQGSREDLWRSLSGKVRNQVRKAARRGLTTQAVPATKLTRFYRLFAHNMRDLGSPVHALAFFDNVFAVLGSRAKLYLTCEPAGRAVACAIALRFRDSLSVPWASSLREARPACPNHSLYWNILRDALAEGCRVFDFGRSTLGSGPARFKKHWGAEAVPLVWTYTDGSGKPEPGESWSSQDHAGLVRMWQHLPLMVANRLGPVVRRRISN